MLYVITHWLLLSKFSGTNKSPQKRAVLITTDAFGVVIWAPNEWEVKGKGEGVEGKTPDFSGVFDPPVAPVAGSSDCFLRFAS